MLVRGRIRWPREHVGQLVRFADGTSGRIYRETTVVGRVESPCHVAVCFRLRAVHGRGHDWFRRESLLNTPMFVGFPGFVSKLWLAHDEHGRYRGIYVWDGAEQAEHYVRSLWRVLDLVCEPGSIDYRILPDRRPDDASVTRDGDRDERPLSEDWWLPVAVTTHRVEGPEGAEPEPPSRVLSKAPGAPTVGSSLGGRLWKR